MHHSQASRQSCAGRATVYLARAYHHGVLPMR
jgi:hypothetical protein